MASVSLKRCGHYPSERRLEADAADLGFAPGKEPFTLFDTLPGAPAAPGVEVRNPRTGNVARFVLARRECDADGDVVAWHFNVHPQTVVQHPKLQGYVLVVFND